MLYRAKMLYALKSLYKSSSLIYRTEQKKQQKVEKLTLQSKNG